MNKKNILFGLGALCLAAPVAVSAQYTVSSVEEALTVSELETALTNAGVATASTSAIDGVALGPGNTVFVIHDNAGVLTLAHVNLDTDTVVWAKTEADIVSDLGLSGNLQLVGEFVYDPTNSRLVLASNIGAVSVGDPWTVFEVDTSGAPYTASVLLSDAGIQGWNSHDVTSTGVIVGALGEEFEVLTGGEPLVGIIDETTTPGTPTFVELFDVDEFKANLDSGDTLGPTEELPPETVGIDLSDDTIYIFGHDNFELVSIEGLGASSPSDPEVDGWDDAATTSGRVDLHGIDVDGNGNVFGFDEAAEAIVVWDGVDVASDITGEFLFSSLKSTLGGAGVLEVTVWRGMKTRALSATETEVFLAPSNADQGLVRVVIDASGPASVSDWNTFE